MIVAITCREYEKILGSDRIIRKRYIKTNY